MAEANAMRTLYTNLANEPSLNEVCDGRFHCESVTYHLRLDCDGGTAPVRMFIPG
jgi:hypothetical protein